MEILESLDGVIKNSELVRINSNKIKCLASKIQREKLNHWLSISPFDLNQLKEEDRLAFLFVLDSISFCYWGNPKWTVEYDRNFYDGAKALMACLGRAVEKEQSILKSSVLAELKRKKLEEILRGNVEIPLLDERLKNLNELGTVTQTHFKGDFRYVLDEGEFNAMKLIDTLIMNYHLFNDSARYFGKLIHFQKRAQLLIGDIGSLITPISEVEKLTACADYKIPQVLRRNHVLEYDTTLEDKIRNKIEICSGSKEEIEIRANTIHAVELIKKELIGVTSQQINDYLWLEGQIKLPFDEPYHLTRTTAY